MERSEVDILVVGSGAAGLTAALAAADAGARVMVLEKGPFYGGSSALSGGAIWAPNNPLMARAGLTDSAEEALAYLRHITDGHASEEKLRAYVETVPRLVRMLESSTRVRFRIVPGYSDYYPGAPGARPDGGRTLEPVPFNVRALGANRDQMLPSHPQELAFGKIRLSTIQARGLLDSSALGRLRALPSVASYFVSPRRFSSHTDTRLCLGNALVARLRCSLADRGIPLELSAPVESLVMKEDRIVGALVRRNGASHTITASRGVILAAGGFERNVTLRSKWQPAPISDKWSAAHLLNTGDGIRMGAEAGGALSLMEDSWWTPTVLVAGEDLAYVLIVEKSLPGGMMVNAAGRRFTNEAAPYIDVVHGMYAANSRPDASIPAWLVFDRKFRARYPMGPLLPSLTPRRYRDNGFLRTASTLAGLARLCGIEPSGLVEEAQKMGRFAHEGIDADFHRGEASIDRYYGDPSIRPNACLGPIDSPPFYAVQVWPGDLGTKGGLVTDVNGRVLREDGSAVRGLYACGNCSASVMAHTYPGAGGTIGPAMTFALLAAEHATRA